MDDNELLNLKWETSQRFNGIKWINLKHFQLDRFIIKCSSYKKQIGRKINEMWNISNKKKYILKIGSFQSSNIPHDSKETNKRS